MSFKLIDPNLTKQEYLDELIFERGVCEKFINETYGANQGFVLEQKSLSEFLEIYKTKPVFLAGDLAIHSKDDPETYVVDSVVFFPSDLESVATRNVPPIPHANQGDFIKTLGESLWMLGNYVFSTWNQTHAAASHKHSGFLSNGYEGKNFARIMPDAEYFLRTMVLFPKVPQFASVLHLNGKPIAYMKGMGQTLESPLRY